MKLVYEIFILTHLILYSALSLTFLARGAYRSFLHGQPFAAAGEAWLKRQTAWLLQWARNLTEGGSHCLQRSRVGQLLAGGPLSTPN